MWGGYFSIFTYIYKRVKSGSGSRFRFRFGLGFVKTRTRPGPASGFFLKKTHTRPYNLSGWVKSDPLGSGRAKYLRVKYKLPSLSLGWAQTRPGSTHG